MKKLCSLCLALCLTIGLVNVTPPVSATAHQNATAVTQETSPSESSASGTSPTEETEPEIVPPGTAPDVAFGTASVTSGCRTIDAQVPLGGNERRLKTAQAAFVFEKNTGTVLYSFNPDTKLSPGSLTKILTAIVAIERGKLDDSVTISTMRYNTLPAGALNAKLKHGEVLSLENLLYCMMLESANDAAISIAEHVAGTEADFVKLMNQKAAEIGCTNSVFVNSHGLDATGQHTTARDMAKIVSYAVQNETFATMFAATNYTVSETNKSEERKLKSDDYLITDKFPKFRDKRVTGGKTSTTASSGASLACTAEENGMNLIFVVMGAKRVYKENGYSVEYYGNFEEIMELIDFSFDGYKYCQIYFENQAMNEFPVANGTNNVVGAPNNSRNAIIPAKAKLDHLILRYEVSNGGLSAPIKKGDQIATVQFWYQSSCLAETELYAMSDVRSTSNPGLNIHSVATRDDSNLKDILSFLGIVCLVLLIPFGIYLIINTIRRSAAEKRRRKRRRNRRRSR